MVYFATDGENIKIGYTKQSLLKRVQQLNTGNSKRIIPLGWIEGDKNLEKQLHIQFGKYRIRYNGEWFAPEQELLDFINQNNLDKSAYIDIIDNQVSKLFRLLGI